MEANSSHGVFPCVGTHHLCPWPAFWAEVDPYPGLFAAAAAAARSSAVDQPDASLRLPAQSLCGAPTAVDAPGELPRALAFQQQRVLLAVLGRKLLLPVVSHEPCAT